MKIIISILLLLPTVAESSRRVNTSQGKVTEDILSTYPLKSVPEEWKKYLDPQSSEFWTEGNHKPDAGFILFLQNMNLENAKLWLLRGEIKARYLERALQLTEQAQRELIQKELIRDRYNVMPNKVAQIKKHRQMDLAKHKQGMKKHVQMFFIFSPSCPHCQTLAGTLRGFPNVYPLQAVGDKIHHWPGLNKTEKATRETLEGYASNGQVPVLVLHHSTSNRALVLKGNRSSEEILIAASQLLAKEK